MKAMMKKVQKKAKGQGVIEYAGALVIAAVLVATVLAVGPDQLGTVFNSILSNVGSYFTSTLSAKGI